MSSSSETYAGLVIGGLSIGSHVAKVAACNKAKT